jgi:inosose dehydratase
VTDIANRLAGAPISWGVSEVPDWGFQSDTATVLSQMQELGLVATELGPEGFLPDDPQVSAKLLADRGLRAVGGFVPLVLHDPEHDPVPQISQTLTRFAATGVGTLVLAAATGAATYEARPRLERTEGTEGLDGLDGSQWRMLLHNLDRVSQLAESLGVAATLHPHVGTMVETPQDVERVLAGSEIGLCLDTGHFLIGGGDPVTFAAEHGARIRHTHLKDVDASWARRVRLHEVTYAEAVRSGLYRPLGQGDVDIASIVGSLESAGYDGWYVLEQDTILAGPAGPGRRGPMGDVQAGIDHLLSVAQALP